MDFRLKIDEDVSGGLRRLITGECEYALDLLSSDQADKHEAVHELRKSGKKIRSALRLIRDEIGYYKQENAFFRDLMRHISDIRDAKANIETLDKLHALYEAQLVDHTFRSVRDYLLDVLKDQETKVFDENDTFIHIRGALEKKLDEIQGWPLDISGLKTVSAGIKRVYKRGRKACKKAGKTRSTPDLHEWRKRVKYLRYQIDILNRIWPGYMAALENELHDVSDWIGFDHDLYNLASSVGQCEEAFDSPEQKRLFHALLNHQRGMFQQLALLKGHRFYIDTPRAFSRKIEVFWKKQKEEVHSRYPTIKHIESRSR
jgi:CHAD domain-containing protein